MLTIFKGATPEALSEIAEEMRVRQTNNFLLLFSMGSQFDHLIVQQLAKLGVFVVVADPSSVRADDVKKRLRPASSFRAAPRRLFTPPTAGANDLPPFDNNIFDLEIPCSASASDSRCGRSTSARRSLRRRNANSACMHFASRGRVRFLTRVAKETRVLESHGDAIEPRSAIEVLGETDNAPVAAGHSNHLWGVQFHPEVTDTAEGQRYENFAVNICGITDRFPAQRGAGESRTAQKLWESPPKAESSSGGKVLMRCPAARILRS